MPNRKNAILALKKSKKRAIRNRSVKSELKTIRKKFENAVEAGKSDDIEQAFNKLQSTVDKTVKKGVIPKGRGNRIKSRYALKLPTTPASE